MIAVKAMVRQTQILIADPNVWHYHRSAVPQGEIFRRIWDPVFVLRILLSWFGLYVRRLALG